MIKISDVAKSINKMCKEYKYFWAFGLVKETKDLWHNESNRNLLCYEAKFMYKQVTEQ